ncbi:unnamed protein product [Ectocarpus sp. 12 AP-2014]
MHPAGEMQVRMVRRLPAPRRSPLSATRAGDLRGNPPEKTHAKAAPCAPSTSPTDGLAKPLQQARERPARETSGNNRLHAVDRPEAKILETKHDVRPLQHTGGFTSSKIPITLYHVIRDNIPRVS